MQQSRESTVIRKVVIPIAGYGTRMFPASKVIPKALFPLIDGKDGLVKPILHMLCDMALEAILTQDGFNHDRDDPHVKLIIIIQESQKATLEHYFFNYELDNVYARDEVMKNLIHRIRQIAHYLEFVVQREQAGLGHAILCARQHLEGEESFMVMLGDHMYINPPNTKSCIAQIINAYQVNGGKQSITSVTTCPESELSVNGILKMNKQLPVVESIFKLESTQEKPSSQLAEQLDLYLTDSQYQQLNIQSERKERECLCYLGIDILTTQVFQIMEQCWIQLQKENETRTKKEEMNLRMHGMKQVIESPDLGMAAVVLKGRRCDTGLPIPYFDAINDIYASTQHNQL